MQDHIDSTKTLEIIERLQLAKIGDYDKWEQLVKKIRSGGQLNEDEIRYFANFAKIYKDGKISTRSKIYHIKLSESDERPPCSECGEKSDYYCNMNDSYFCLVHVIGHDENEK